MKLMQKQEMSVETARPSTDTSLARYKLTVCLAIIVTVVAAVVIVVLVYFAFMRTAPTSPTEQHFQVVKITANDVQEHRKVDLEYNVDNVKKVAYVTFPDEDGQLVLGFRDFQKGVEAFRRPDENVCIITKLNDDGDDDNEEAIKQSKEPQVVSVNSSGMFVILNDTIYPTIQQLAIGKRVSNFCGELRQVWMIPEEEANPIATQGRKKRTITAGGPPAPAFFRPHNFHQSSSRNRCTYSCTGTRFTRCTRRCSG